jgi:hypothetical protein
VYGEERVFPHIRAFVGWSDKEYGFFRWIETARPPSAGVPFGIPHIPEDIRAFIRCDGKECTFFR